MSDTTRERAERLAAEKYPFGDPGFDPYPRTRTGFIAGYLTRAAEPVTVSAEQVALTADDLWQTFAREDDPFERHSEYWRQRARLNFRAANIRIEGDDG